MIVCVFAFSGRFDIRLNILLA
jgi:hypothetical protein